MSSSDSDNKNYKSMCHICGKYILNKKYEKHQTSKKHLRILYDKDEYEKRNDTIYSQNYEQIPKTEELPKFVKDLLFVLNSSKSKSNNKCVIHLSYNDDDF